MRVTAPEQAERLRQLALLLAELQVPRVPHCDTCFVGDWSSAPDSRDASEMVLAARAPRRPYAAS